MGIGREAGTEPMLRLVLLVSMSECMPLRFGAVEACLREYMIEGDGGFRVDIRNPRAAERQKGAAVVLEITPDL